MSAAPSTTDTPDVWCALEIVKAGAVAIQRGRISRADLDAWARGEHRGAIVLHEAYWLNEGEAWEVLGMTAGPWALATGTVYVRADIVIGIVMMHDGDDERALRGMSDGPTS